MSIPKYSRKFAQVFHKVAFTIPVGRPAGNVSFQVLVTFFSVSKSAEGNLSLSPFSDFYLQLCQAPTIETVFSKVGTIDSREFQMHMGFLPFSFNERWTFTTHGRGWDHFSTVEYGMFISKITCTLLFLDSSDCKLFCCSHAAPDRLLAVLFKFAYLHQCRYYNKTYGVWPSNPKLNLNLMMT